MMDSNAVHDVLAEVFSAGEPPSDGGAAAVFARAARMRKRQRMVGAAAATATAVATATVIVGAASLGAGHSASRTGSPAAGGPAGGSSPACHATKCEAASREVPSGGAMGPPDFDVYATLTRMLPSAGSIRDAETQPGYAGVNIVDPRGTTHIDVNVQLDAAAHVVQLLDCGTRQLPAGTQCDAVTQKDGTRMLTSDGPNAEGPLGIQERQVDVLYPDGRRVVIGEWNAADEYQGSVTRQTPLLTLDQLITLATAADWRK